MFNEMIGTYNKFIAALLQLREKYLMLQNFKDRALMGMKKKTFLLKKATQYSLPIVQPSLDMGNSLK